MGRDKETKAMPNVVISQDKIDFILSHKDDFPRSRYIRLSGVCKATFYKILRTNGYIDATTNDHHEEIEIIKTNYPYMSISEIREKYHISLHLIKSTVKRFGLTHTKETERRFRQKRTDCLRNALIGIDRTPWVEKFKQTRKKEVWRYLCGMPQKTKMYISPLTKKARYAKKALIYKYKYFPVYKEPFVLCYDKLTRRINDRSGNGKNFDEAFYSKKYGFVFEPADED